MNGTLAMAAAVVVGAAIGATAKQVATPRSTYTDTAYGFSIQAPKFPKVPAEGNVIPVIFNAPPENSFASNVNVMVQNTRTTRKVYQELTNQQFQRAGITLISEKVKKVSGKDAIEWEYKKEVQDNALHFLQLAIIDTDRVLLATCTTHEEKFAKFAPEFRASLGSIKLTSKK